MAGITVVDRRDLERLLKAMVHSLHRDDVQVDIKYYVQFSVNDDYSAQTLVDPWQPFSRAACRDLVNAAVNKLDEEERKNGYNRKALQVVSGGDGEHLEAAKAEADTNPYAGQDLSPGIGDLKPAESSGVIGDSIEYDENAGMIL